MTEWFGWAGTILRIDLTKEEIIKQPLTKEMAYNFLGGRGFNSKVLWDEIEPRIDPLGPKNVLCLGVGPLNGTLMSLSGRSTSSCLSAMTGIFGDGNMGGVWGAELKIAGYDQIVVTGKSKKPVYVWIDDDNVEIKDASHLWGTTTWEADRIIRHEHGRDVSVCGIGQGGENLVRTASTICDLSRSSNPGSGAVWGSKNLKAVTVRGTKGVKIARPKEFERLVEEDRNYLLNNEYIQGTIGTIGSPGHTPYWQASNDPKIVKEKLGGEKLLEQYQVSLESCFNCPVHCGRYYRILIGPYAGTRGLHVDSGGSALVANSLRNFNLASALKANSLCDQYGLCASQARHAIGFAMKLYERGILTKKHTGGIAFEWGDDKLEIEMIHKIALREGFGNMLAEGGYGVAKIIGKKTKELFKHVYGSERGLVGRLYNLAIATSTRGADHLRGLIQRVPPKFLAERGLIEDECKVVSFLELKEEAVVIGQHEMALADSLERCKCSVTSYAISCPLPMYPLGEGRSKLLSAATGKKWTPQELDLLGERIYNIERAFSVRFGASRKHDRPTKEYLSKGYDKSLDRYYTLRGWDKMGIPTRAKLEELGLKYVADELEKGKPYSDWDGPPLWPLKKYPRGGNRAEY